MDDQSIVGSLWERTKDALTEYGLRFGAYCRKIANNILHNADDANECVNETWLKAWNAIPLAMPVRLGAFLGRGAVDAGLNELADIPVPEESDEGENARAINSFLRFEPPGNDDIFIKRYWYLADVNKISTEYGCSGSKISSLLFRMRRRLKAKLESDGLM
jgi:RNA polymerase sigma-70 factor (ECF subfamily)